jgi:hypothetical protein
MFFLVGISPFTITLFCFRSSADFILCEIRIETKTFRFTIGTRTLDANTNWAHFF